MSVSTLKKTFLVLCSIFLLLSLPVLGHAAEDANCVKTFYQTKDTACIDVLIKSLPTEPKNNSGTNETKSENFPSAIGFLAEIFHSYPKEKERILSQDVHPVIKITYIEALIEANLEDEAQAYASVNGLTQVTKYLKDHGLSSLQNLKPTSLPSDNDMLIGAYMASGNIDYIKKILANFSDANDDMVRDSLRMSMLQAKFGPTLVPSGRETTTVKAACQKYECNKDMTKLMRVMTLSSAFWASQTLALNDHAIQKTLKDFFESDPRLKKLFLIENNAFNNYMTLAVAFSAVKDNPNINNAMSIYEHLGTDQDATAALMQKKN